MKFVSIFFVLTVLLTTSFVSCVPQNKIDKEELEDVLKNVETELNQAAEEVEEAMEEVSAEVGKAAEEVSEEIERATEEISIEESSSRFL